MNNEKKIPIQSNPNPRKTYTNDGTKVTQTTKPFPGSPGKQPPKSK